MEKTVITTFRLSPLRRMVLKYCSRKNSRSMTGEVSRIIDEVFANLEEFERMEIMDLYNKEKDNHITT